MNERQFWHQCDDDALLKIHDSYARLAVTHRAEGHYRLAYYCRQLQVRALVELSLRAQEAQERDNAQLRLY